MRTIRLLLLAGLLTPLAAAAADWPAYRGPSADGHSPETGILESWPAAGPTRLWQAELGSGYSGMSVVDGRLFTLYGDGTDEYLLALDADTGSRLWRVRLDRERKDNFGDGPRSTPTVADGVVHALGARGKLVAVEAATGDEIWSRDLVADFGAEIPNWGVATSPTVYRDLLLVDVGGKDGHGVVALARADGELRWSAESGKPGYSTPLVGELAGREQALFLTGTKLVAVAPADGTILWTHPWRTSYDVNAAMPILLPPDKVFVSTGYDTGAAVLQVTRSGDVFTVQEIWKGRQMKNQFNSSVLVDGHIYGFDNGILKCIRAEDGSELWAARGFSKGSLLFVDGNLIVFGERGQLALIEATPEEYREVATVDIFNEKTWTMPTLADGILYLRTEKQLVALDLRRPDAGSTQDVSP